MLIRFVVHIAPYLVVIVDAVCPTMQIACILPPCISRISEDVVMLSSIQLKFQLLCNSFFLFNDISCVHLVVVRFYRVGQALLVYCDQEHLYSTKTPIDIKPCRSASKIFVALIL